MVQRAFFYFLCTVSGYDVGNRTRNIAVYTWRFSPLSYGHAVNFVLTKKGRIRSGEERLPLGPGKLVHEQGDWMNGQGEDGDKAKESSWT